MFVKQEFFLVGVAAIVLWLFKKANDSGGAGDDFTQTISDYVGTGAAIVSGRPTKMSQAGQNYLKGKEGFSAYKYPDYKGFSIGRGHLIKEGESFDEPMSMDTADELFVNDIGWAERAVANGVEIEITQSMFDALVSFTYNEGGPAFRGSTLLKKLNAGDIDGARNEFSKWVYSGGSVNPVLVARRAEEAGMFV